MRRRGRWRCLLDTTAPDGGGRRRPAPGRRAFRAAGALARILFALRSRPSRRRPAMARDLRARRLPFGAELRARRHGPLPALGAGRSDRVGAGRSTSASAPLADDRAGGRLVRARPPAARARQPLPLRAGRRLARCPTRPRARSPTTCMGPSVVVDPRGLRLAAPGLGAAGRGTRRCSTSCTSAPSAPRAPSTALRRRLDHLAELGVTAIELMPLADFSGRRNWGYDGVLPFAPDARLRPAGRPEAPDRRGAWPRADGLPRRRLQPLRARRELSAAATRPSFFDRGRAHALGRGDRLHGQRPVRDFVDPQRALLARGVPLRRPAASTPSHAIVDRERGAHPGRDRGDRAPDDPGASATSTSCSRTTPTRRACSSATPTAGRSTTTRSGTTTSTTSPITLLTGERGGYYADYADAAGRAAGARARPGLRLSGRALGPSRRRAARRAERRPAADRVRRLPAEPRSDRQPRLRRAARRAAPSPPRSRRCRRVLLLAPHVPLLFMGEEWGAHAAVPASSADFHDELADAVREGRRREFSRFPRVRRRGGARAIPDPNAAATFAASRLDWSVLAAAGACRLAGPACAMLLRIRREMIVPRLAGGAVASLGATRWIEAALQRRLAAGRRRAPEPASPTSAPSRERLPAARGRAAVREPSRGWSRRSRHGAAARLVARLVPDAAEALTRRRCPTSRRRPSRARPTGCSSTPASASTTARRIVPYLARLGISHLYASPITMARPGSTHGYDVIDFNRLNPELGDEAGFERSGRGPARHGMGLLARLRAQPHGRRRRQPLVAGRARMGPGEPVSPSFFDIDWEASARGVARQAAAAGAGRPVRQGAGGGRAAAGLRCRPPAASACATHDHRFPIALAPLRAAAARRGRPARQRGRRADRARPALRRAGERRHRARAARRAAARGRRRSRPRSRRWPRDADGRARRSRPRPARLNGTPGKPQSFRDLAPPARGAGLPARLLAGRELGDQLPPLLRHQRARRPAHGAAGGVRGDPPAAVAPDRRAARCRACGSTTSTASTTRRATASACWRASREVLPACAGEPPRSTPRPAGRSTSLVEKILARHEYLREDLPVAGTTGYEFIGLVDGLFVDPAAERPLTATYERFIGRSRDFAEVVAGGQAPDPALLRSTASCTCWRTSCIGSRSRAGGPATSR